MGIRRNVSAQELSVLLPPYKFISMFMKQLNVLLFGIFSWKDFLYKSQSRQMKEKFC